MSAMPGSLRHSPTGFHAAMSALRMHYRRSGYPQLEQGVVDNSISNKASVAGVLQQQLPLSCQALECLMRRLSLAHQAVDLEQIGEGGTLNTKA